MRAQAESDGQEDRHIGKICVGASSRGMADRQMELWVQTGAAQIGAHSHPVCLLFFITPPPGVSR